MNPEPEQAEPKVDPKAEPKTAKRRAGVPVWRTGKPDAVLAAAVLVRDVLVPAVGGRGLVGVGRRAVEAGAAQEEDRGAAGPGLLAATTLRSA